MKTFVFPRTERHKNPSHVARYPYSCPFVCRDGLSLKVTNARAVQNATDLVFTSHRAGQNFDHPARQWPRCPAGRWGTSSAAKGKC